MDAGLLRGNKLEIDEASFELASLGLKLHSDADIRFKGLIIDKDLPASFATNLKLGMDHTAIEHEGLNAPEIGSR